MALNSRRLLRALTLVLLCLLVLSGAGLAFYYTPVPGTAYDSTDFVQFNLPFGALIRGVHHYAWQAFLVVVSLYLAGEFLAAAYKAPRQGVWISGVVVFLLIPLCIVTGDLLPWDQKAYWTTRVRLGILGSVPWVGDFLVRVVQGGSVTGVVALTRFYVLHILLLPSALAFMICLHLYAVVASEASGGITSIRTKAALPGLLLLFSITSAILWLASRWAPAPLGDPADPSDTSFVPRPEWWVLPLNQLVTHLDGPFAVLASTLIPIVSIALLLALPYLDRRPGRKPRERLHVLIPASIAAATVIGLAIAGYLEHYAPGGANGPAGTR